MAVQASSRCRKTGGRGTHFGPDSQRGRRWMEIATQCDRSAAPQVGLGTIRTEARPSRAACYRQETRTRQRHPSLHERGSRDELLGPRTDAPSAKMEADGQSDRWPYRPRPEPQAGLLGNIHRVNYAHGRYAMFSCSPEECDLELGRPFVDAH